MKQQDAAERGRDRADEKPPDELPSDCLPPDVDTTADRLHDHRGDEIGGDRRRRRHPEEDQEDGSHEGSSAHAGQADGEADDHGREGDGPIDVHGSKGYVGARAGSDHCLRSRTGSSDTVRLELPWRRSPGTAIPSRSATWIPIRSRSSACGSTTRGTLGSGCPRPWPWRRSTPAGARPSATCCSGGSTSAASCSTRTTRAERDASWAPTLRQGWRYTGASSIGRCA